MVTFETAIKLKEAGFPQPASQFGQNWYDEDQEAIVVVGAGDVWPNDDGDVFQLVWCVAKNSADGVFETNNVEMAKWAYCPTVTEILKDAKGLYLSPMMHDDWGVFVIGSRKMAGFHLENPAEACAEAWLEMKAQQLDMFEKLEPDED